MKLPFRGFTAILYKEFLVVWRDPMTLFFMFFPPLVQLVAFGFALDTDVKHMATLVLDEDRTRESRELIDQFVNTQTFKVVGRVASVTELAEAIFGIRPIVSGQVLLDGMPAVIRHPVEAVAAGLVLVPEGDLFGVPVVSSP